MSDTILPTLDTVQKLMQCLLGNGVQAKQSVTGPDTAQTLCPRKLCGRQRSGTSHSDLRSGAG